MSGQNLEVERINGHFKISGPNFDQSTLDQGQWNATRLDSGRLLLVSKKSGSSPDTAESFAKCSIDVLHDMLLGISHRHWTGVVAIDTGFGSKKLYFNKGNLVFASSNLIDDRLGEVIYREEMITLDQLTNSAVQVDRSTKFGQVLLKDKIFSNTDLWNALKNQVFEIFRSVFILPEVYFEIVSGNPPTEVTFNEGTITLIESASSAGKQFRSFFKRLRADSKISVVEGERVRSLPAGTFFADMIHIARSQPLVSDFLEVSKLTDLNSLWILHRMACLGYVAFVNLSEPEFVGSDANFSKLRAKIDTFSMLQTFALKAFEDAKVAYPVEQIQKFAWSLNEGHLAAIYIEDSGLLGAECVGNVMSQCVGSSTRSLFFENRFDTLVRYALQVVGDMLPSDFAKNVRRQYAEIA